MKKDKERWGKAGKEKEKQGKDGTGEAHTIAGSRHEARCWCDTQSRNGSMALRGSEDG
jgi:hypothetical protein